MRFRCTTELVNMPLLNTMETSLTTNDAIHLSVDDVDRWAESNFLSVGTRKVLKEHEVDGSALIDLKQVELKSELAITSLPGRKRLLGYIVKLRNGEANVNYPQEDKCSDEYATCAKCDTVLCIRCLNVWGRDALCLSRKCSYWFNASDNGSSKLLWGQFSCAACREADETHVELMLADQELDERKKEQKRKEWLLDPLSLCVFWQLVACKPFQSLIMNNVQRSTSRS